MIAPLSPRRVRPGIALLALLLAAAPARATLYETLGIGARATAMGGAYTAIADTPGAKYYNPAGLTQLIGGPGSDQSIGTRVVWTNFQIDQRFPSDIAVPPDETYRPSKYNETFFQPDLSGGFEIGDRVYVSLLALTTSWAGYVQYSEKVGDQRFSAYEAGQLFLNYTPRVAVRITDWLSIGGGPDVQAFHEVKRTSRLGDGYVTSSVARSLGITPEQTEALFGLLGVRNDGIDDGKIFIRTKDEFPTGLKPFNDLDSHWQDVGFTVGVHLTPLEWLRLGVTYRSQLDVTTKGLAEFNVREEDPVVRFLSDLSETPFGPALGLTEGFQDSTVPQRIEFVLPRQVAVGVAVEPVAGWLLSTDLVWTDWSSRQRDVVEFGGNGLGPPSFDSDDDPSTPDTGVLRNVAVRDFRDTLSVRVGSEVALGEHLRLRGGYWWDPHPQNSNRYYSLDTGFDDRHVLSGGIGIVGLDDGWLDVSFTVQHVLFDTRTVAPGEGQNLGGTRASVDPVNDGLANNDGYDLEIGGDLTTVALEVMFHFDAFD